MNGNGEHAALEAANGTVRRLLTEVLLRKLAQAGVPAAGIDETTELMDLGVIDSQDLLDVILEVEEGCGFYFDALRLDLESEVTLQRIATAVTLAP